ncbi:MAG: MerR family DNA-binding transcriptional regulator [Dehalococcoidia bacterium]
MTERDSADTTVGLSGAAAIAGVSISTLRRWADEGRLPSFRTAGGHRRFRVSDIQRALAPVRPESSEVEVFGEMATNRIRRQLSASRARDLDWLSGIDEHGRERLGLLGRHLLATIEEYLARRRPRAAVLAEARQFGLIYGRELASSQFTVRQAIEAFTFFRRGIEEAARRYSAQSHFTQAEVEDLRDQLDVLNDRLLLGIAEAYEDTPPRSVDAPL